jgi:hypothetical protein
MAALLALGADPGASRSAAAHPDPASTLAGSPTAFAERIAASRTATGARIGESLREILELVVLAAVCAIGVAFYSAASTGPDERPLPGPRRR